MSAKTPVTKWLIVIALLLLAFGLRTVALVEVPPGLHNDEVMEIQTTESVVNGRVGIFFPEDTGHEVLYYYFAAPFLRVLGSTPFAMRLPSVFLSMISMCVIWVLTRRLLGATEALSAAAGFAVVFWTVAFGRIISHVCMEVPLAALAAYFFWRGRASHGARAVALWGLSGLWLGLSINAYTAARILPVIYVAFGLYTLLTAPSDWPDWRKGVAITLAVAALVALPLALYLFQHPAADQLSFFDINRPLVELRKGNFGPVVGTSLRTLGMFAFVGDPLPYFDVPGRPIFGPVGALLFAGGLIIALRRWREPEYAFTVLWFLLSLVPGMLSQPAPSYTRTIGAQIVLFAFPGIAISALIRRVRHIILYVALILLFVGNLAWTAHSYFVVWPRLRSVQFWHQSGLKAVADRLNERPDTSPVAICVPDHLINEHDPWWKPARLHMRYLLHRPDLSTRYYSCADAMVLVGAPARYAFPDIAGVEQLRDLPIYDHFLGAVNTQVTYLPEDMGAIVRVKETGTPAQLVAGILSEPNRTSATEAEQGRLSASHLDASENDAELLTYTLSTSSLKPGETFSLTTYWLAAGELSRGLVQFTHVLSADGTIVAQADRLAVDSGSLLPGDVFAQVHRLSLSDDLSPGKYPLSVGLYTPSDGVRLQVGQEDRASGTELPLESIVVKK